MVGWGWVVEGGGILGRWKVGEGMFWVRVGEHFLWVGRGGWKYILGGRG